ncbi:MAG: porin, partial [Novacetimonas hansenii]
MNTLPASSSPATAHHTQEDRPLSGAAHPAHPRNWTLYWCEMVATPPQMKFGGISVAVLTAPQGAVGAFLA